MGFSLGTVQEDATIYVPMSTSGDGGVEEDFSGTLEEADFIIRKDGSTMTLDANTINSGSALSSFSTGLYEVPIDLSNDSDFTGGSDYLVYAAPDSETLNSLNVSGFLAHFRIESADQKATRQLREALYSTGAAVATTTGNTTNTVNLSDIADASALEGHYAGELLAIEYVGGTYDGVLLIARITAYATSNQLATVELLDGDLLPEAVAVGDRIYRIGQYTAKNSGLNDLPSETQVNGVGDSTNTLLTRISETIPFSTAGKVQVDVQELLDNQLAEGGSAPGSPIGYQ